MTSSAAADCAKLACICMLLTPSIVSAQDETRPFVSDDGSILLDTEGRVVERFMGAKPRKVLERKIAELLPGAPAT